MTIEKKNVDGRAVIALNGRLDTATAPTLEAPLLGALAENAAVLLDITQIDYLSSAGLRVLMMAQKYAGANGKQLVLTGVCEAVMEVFEMTGFSDILTIE